MAYNAMVVIETAATREAAARARLGRMFPRMEEFTGDGNCLGLRFSEVMEEYVSIVRGDKSAGPMPHLRVMRGLYEAWETRLAA